jgi:endonuclease/exonuclease/phosphatase family metal-dependent hydrolase
LDNGLTNEKRTPVLSRIYQTLNPDVLALNECWEVSAARAQRFFNQNLQLEGDEEWQAVKLDEGNITVSRYPVAEQWQIADEMRLTAAKLRHPAGPLLLINAHLSCCDQNAQRKEQAKALMAFLEEAHQSGGRVALKPATPIIVAGDMNLVGEGRTLSMLTGDTTLQQAFKPDWDYTPLQVVSNPHTHGHFNYTWKSLETGWPAGKLDYMLYSSSVLKPARAYTLNTSLLPDSLLSQLRVKANATDRASDHYPLVTDFIIGESRGPAETRLLPGRLGHSSYSFNLDPAIRQVNIYNRQGKAVYDQNPDQALRLDLTGWQSGIYYVAYKKDGASQVESFMVGP